jgi:hypothetical protein
MTNIEVKGKGKHEGRMTKGGWRMTNDE